MARRRKFGIILSNVSWETYNEFVEEIMDKIVIRVFTLTKEIF